MPTLSDKITLNIVDVDPQYKHYNLVTSKNTLTKKWVGTGSNLAIRIDPNILDIYATVAENESESTILDSNTYTFSFYTSTYNDLGVEYEEIKEFKYSDYTDVFEHGASGTPYVILKNYGDYSKYEFNTQIFYIESEQNTSSDLYDGMKSLSSNTYYQKTLDTEEKKAAYKEKLKELFEHLGGALHSDTSVFGLILYLKVDSTYVAARGPYYIDVQWDSNSAAAKLNIGKYDITAAVDNSVMEFTGRGLNLYLSDSSPEDTGLAIYSGGTSESHRVFYANSDGDLVLHGDVYANNGYFNGTVNATDGVFNGTVNATDGVFNGYIYADYGEFKGQVEAKSGLIGGVTIDNSSLYTLNTSGSGNKFNFIIDPSGIYANSLEIGNEAVIRDYLLLGDETGLYGKIYNPNRTQDTDYKFIEVGNGIESIINIKSDATGNIGNIYFDGNNSKMWGDNNGFESWSLTPDIVNFQNVTVQGTISTAIFEKKQIQLSGGTFLFKDGMYIEPFLFSLSDDTNYTSFLVKSGENFQVIAYPIEGQTPVPESNKYYYKYSKSGEKYTFIEKVTGLTTFTEGFYYFEDLEVFQSGSFFKFVDEDSELIVNHLYALTNTEKSNFIYFRYRGEDDSSGPYKFYSTEDGLYNLIIDLGKIEITTDTSGEQYSCYDYMIGINATSQDYHSLGLNANALTVSRFEMDDEFSQGNIKTMILLGYLPMTLTGLDDDTYGLYAESVYITGTLTTKYVDDETKYAGVNTLNGARFTQTWDGMTPDQSRIVFWAGSESLATHSIQQAPFQITSNGTLYASQGYFEGSILTNATIEAAKIVTAELTGKSDQAALIIRDSDTGIQFFTDNDEKKMELTSERLLLNIPFKSTSEIYSSMIDSQFIRVNDNSSQTLYLLSNGIRFYDYDLFGSDLNTINKINNYFSFKYNKDINNQGIEFAYKSDSAENIIMKLTSSQVKMTADVNIKKNLTFDSKENIMAKYTINDIATGIDIYISRYDNTNSAVVGIAVVGNAIVNKGG